MYSLLEGRDKLENHKSDEDRELWRVRNRDMHAILVGSISNDLLERFNVEARSGNARTLWEAITRQFAAARVQNPTYIRAQLYSRLLKRDERVSSYVQSLQKLRQDLCDHRDTMSERELVRIMMTNCRDVYPSVTEKFDRIFVESGKEPSLDEASRIA